MLDKETFLKKYQIKQEDFERTSLRWEDLASIHRDHTGRIPKLKKAMVYLRNNLDDVQNVHSIRSRVKDAEHLIEKIIRKRIQKPDVVINSQNYKEKITDLIGIRILHLFKEDWPVINNHIKSTWNLHEKVVANVRQGDGDKLIDGFRTQGFDIKFHESGYRSVHYIITFSPDREQLLAEIQVRTIFEEAWSEIDHTVRYPYFTDNALLVNLLMIFNRIAGSADELGSYIRALAQENLQSLIVEAQKEEDILKLNKEITSLRDEISLLKIGESQKHQLEKKLNLIAKSTTVETSVPDATIIVASAGASQTTKVDIAAVRPSIAELMEFIRVMKVQKR